MTAEEIADAILTAAGTSLRHYMPGTKERILDAALDVRVAIIASERASDFACGGELAAKESGQ